MGDPRLNGSWLKENVCPDCVAGLATSSTQPTNNSVSDDEAENAAALLLEIETQNRIIQRATVDMRREMRIWSHLRKEA